MQITLFTLFPDYFTSAFKTSMIGRAVEKNKIALSVVNIRDFATDKHHITDDRPYGGGPGMVLKVEPIARALDAHSFFKGQAQSLIALTSAKGERFVQKTAQTWSQLERLAIICGHYEGVDERVADYLVDCEVRIGDFVLTGGEPAAAALVDSVARLVPGVLGNDSSLLDESHTIAGIGGFPQFTRPSDFRGWKVPESLVSGDHAAIEAWRQAQKNELTD